MKLKLIFGLLSISALSSCLTIFQPLATKNNIITDDRLFGQWQDQHTRKIVVQRFLDSELKEVLKDTSDYTKEDSIYYTKMYVIHVFEKNYDYTWLGGLVNIKGHKFINLLPVECMDRKGNEKVGVDGKASASIARLEYNGSSINLQFLNGDYVKQILLDGKAHLRYEYDPLFGNMAVTASSEELEKFLEKYGDYEQLYTGGESLTLRK